MHSWIEDSASFFVVTKADENYKQRTLIRHSEAVNAEIETDSFFRLHIHSKNPMNQIKAYVYDSEALDIHAKPIFVS